MNTIVKTKKQSEKLTVIKSFEEWLKVYEATDVVEVKVGLLHSLNDARFLWGPHGVNCHTIVKLGDFLLDVADGHILYSNDEPRNRIRDMAFRILVNRFFKKHTHYNSGRWEFWEELVTYNNGSVLKKIFTFFTHRKPTFDENTGWDGRLFENLPPQLVGDDKRAKHHYEVVRDFLLELADIVYSEIEPKKGQRSLEDVWLAEITSVEMRVRMIQYIDHYGKLWEFFRNRIGHPPGYNISWRGINPEVIEELRKMALTREVPLLSTYVKPETLEEAVLGRSVAAFIVTLHEIGLKEFERMTS